jgi:TadE-like protein
MTFFGRLLHDRAASGAAEFALVLPLLMVFLFGIIDAGRFMWEYNEAEKATQMGARFAAVADPAPSGLSTYSFSISGGIPQGTAVPTSSFDYAVCNDTGCGDCAGSFCGNIGYNNAAFRNIVDRMSLIYPQIGYDNVEVEYRNVGLGFAGDPDGPDVSALVTVRLTGLTFQPITCFVFDCSVTMPDFRAGLTLEDASGTVSN